MTQMLTFENLSSSSPHVGGIPDTSRTVMGFHRVIAALGGAAVLLLSGAPVGAQAEHVTVHYSVGLSEPSVTPCDPPLDGVLTVAGEGVFTLTDSGRSSSSRTTCMAGSASFRTIRHCRPRRGISSCSTERT
jgi:hypothetical protein